jgi:hypothetical protein
LIVKPGKVVSPIEASRNKKEPPQSSLSGITVTFDLLEMVSRMVSLMNGTEKLKTSPRDTGNLTVCWGHDAPYDVAFKEPLYEVTA